MTSSDALDDAIHLHREGALAAAGRAYEAILAREPGHPDALHLLGVLANQRGEPAQAVALIGSALAARPAVPEYYASLSDAHRALGRDRDAVACAREALRLRPAFAEAANGLGLSLLAAGQVDEAVAQLRAAVALQPQSAVMRNNLAHVLRLRGDRRECFEHLRQAVRLDPALPEARSNLAQVLLEVDLLDDALEHANAAVAQRPGSPEFQNTLGNVLRALGWLDDALACYLRAVEAAPAHADSYSNVGTILADRDRLEEAAEWFLRALSINARCADALGNLGWVRHLQSRAAEADDLYRRALAIDPALGTALVNLGLLRGELGDDADAERWLREALRREPSNALARARLAMLLRERLPDEDLTELRRVAHDHHLGTASRAALQFGLAQVLDARHDHARAAEEAESANALRLADWRRRGLGYDPAAHERFVEGLIAEFTPGFFTRAEGLGDPTDRPVFVFGLPRSGTSLTEQILASHRQVCGAGELMLARRAFESLGANGDRNAGLADWLARLDARTARTLTERYLADLRARDGRAARVSDKMPENYLYLGLLAVLFPRARFILCRRDRRDVALSCWLTDFQQIRWASDQDHITWRFGAHRRLMDHWRQVLPVPLLEVDYEQTVADPEGTARQLVDWCGLEWDPACLEFHQTRRAVHTSSARQVRQPIYTHAVGRWRSYEPALGSWFERLGQGPL